MCRSKYCTSKSSHFHFQYQTAQQSCSFYVCHDFFVFHVYVYCQCKCHCSEKTKLFAVTMSILILVVSRLFCCPRILSIYLFTSACWTKSVVFFAVNIQNYSFCNGDHLVITTSRVTLDQSLFVHSFGACELVAAAMARFPRNIDVQHAACVAVGNLANRHAENKQRLGAAGACNKVQ